MSGDKLVFDLSQESESVANVFIKKSYLNILDNQNGNYNNNQCIIDTSQLTNSNKYMSYREAYLAVPMLITLTSTTNSVAYAPATSATSSDYAVGLKNWFGNVIHNLTLDVNGTTIIQQTPFSNMWNSFKLMTSLSWSDVTTEGATMGFYPDNPLAWSIQTADSTSGRQVCNNTNFSGQALGSVVTATHNSYSAANGNIGFLKRQQYINYDPDASAGNANYSTLLPNTSCNLLWKSYVSNKVNGTVGSLGAYQVSIMGIIHLRHLHSFFNQIPLLKGVFMKLTLALNNTSINYTVAADVYTLNSVSNAVGGICPIMLSSAAANQGAAASFGDLTYNCSLSVGAVCLNPAQSSLNIVQQGTLARSIYLYVPAYDFNPVFEQAYLSSPIKKIDYTDIYQYQILNVPALTGQVNNLVTNGIANLKSVLVLPFYSASSNGVLAGGGNIAPWLSPYDPAGTGPTSPLCHLSNFNVVVSGQNMIYNTQKYSFEQFINQLYGTNAVNSGMVDGLTSGLIDQLGFEMEYCYYYVDVSRMLPVEEQVPKSVQIVGQNVTNRILDLLVFCEYGVSVSFDVISGARV